jgi:TPR repeat protein
MYRNGRGVIPSEAEASKWLSLAAEHGIADSQWRLGDMYRTGDGVPQDYVLAHMWFNLAAANGTASLKQVAAFSREEVERHMTPAEIAESQKLAREWTAKHLAAAAR